MSAQEKNSRPSGSGETISLDDEFKAMLGKELNRTGDELAPVTSAVEELLKSALNNVNAISDDVLEEIAGATRRVDALLTEQINAILHDAEFQKLEATWRGLQHLAGNTQWGAHLQLKVLDIQKDELIPQMGSTAKFDQTPLFKKMYDQEYGTFGGNPYGIFVADFEFDHGTNDIAIMKQLAGLGAAGHSPVVAAASTKMFGCESWSDMLQIEDIGEKLALPEMGAWQSLRKGADSKYLALTAPRFIGRSAYDPRTAGFNFKEEVSPGGEGFVWCNSAYAFVRNVARAYEASGWTSQIVGPNSGGGVSNLPLHLFESSDGIVETQCPTEVAIPSRREKELADNGFITLCHRKNSADAVFFSATSIYKSKKYTDKDATASEKLSGQLNYMLPVSRFAHYLNVKVHEMLGTSRNKEQLERELREWIKDYVHPNPVLASDADKAKKPLAKAEINLEEHEDNPGVYEASFKLTPHFQLSEMNIGLTLVSNIDKKSARS